MQQMLNQEEKSFFQRKKEKVRVGCFFSLPVKPIVVVVVVAFVVVIFVVVIIVVVVFEVMVLVSNGILDIPS